jgi:hypothetical protein
MSDQGTSDQVSPFAAEEEAIRARIVQAGIRAKAEAQERRDKEINMVLPPERGGPKGLEPTRYGDWERKGIVSDF